ncbi:hypothetical protein ACPS01_27895 [Priestia aryabhattai]
MVKINKRTRYQRCNCSRKQIKSKKIIANDNITSNTFPLVFPNNITTADLASLPPVASESPLLADDSGPISR